jgi:hypothetical protein
MPASEPHSCVRRVATACASSPSSPTRPPCATSSPTSVSRRHHPGSRPPEARRCGRRPTPSMLTPAGLGTPRLSLNRPKNSISASPGSQPPTASRRGATPAHACGRHARAAGPPAHASNRTRAENQTRGELQPPHFPVCLVASSRDTLPQQAPRGVGFRILISSRAVCEYERPKEH